MCEMYGVIFAEVRVMSILGVQTLGRAWIE